MKFRKFSIGVLLLMLGIGNASALNIGSGTIGTGSGPIGTPGNNSPWVQPNHGGSIGGCNKDGSFCWSIDIEGGYQQPPPRRYPDQIFGFRAKNLITHGQITYADLNTWDVMQLGVYNRGWYWDCEIDLRTPMAQYRCTAQ